MDKEEVVDLINDVREMCEHLPNESQERRDLVDLMGKVAHQEELLEQFEHLRFPMYWECGFIEYARIHLNIDYAMLERKYDEICAKIKTNYIQ